MSLFFYGYNNVNYSILQIQFFCIYYSRMKFKTAPQLTKKAILLVGKYLKETSFKEPLKGFNIFTDEDVKIEEALYLIYYYALPAQDSEENRVKILGSPTTQWRLRKSLTKKGYIAE